MDEKTLMEGIGLGLLEEAEMGKVPIGVLRKIEHRLVTELNGMVRPGLELSTQVVDAAVVPESDLSHAGAFGSFSPKGGAHGREFYENIFSAISEKFEPDLHSLPGIVQKIFTEETVKVKGLDVNQLISETIETASETLVTKMRDQGKILKQVTGKFTAVLHKLRLRKEMPDLSTAIDMDIVYLLLILYGMLKAKWSTLNPKAAKEDDEKRAEEETAKEPKQAKKPAEETAKAQTAVPAQEAAPEAEAGLTASNSKFGVE